MCNQSMRSKMSDFKLVKLRLNIDIVSHPACSEGLVNIYFLWKSDLSDKIKPEFFQAVPMSELLYGSTIEKCWEKYLNGNSKKLSRAVSNKSRKQSSTKQPMCLYVSPISQTMQPINSDHTLRK